MPAPVGHKFQKPANEPTCSITFFATISLRDRIKRRANSQGISASLFLVRLISENLAEMDERDFDGERVVAKKAEPHGTAIGRMSDLGSSGPKTYDARTGQWK